MIGKDVLLGHQNQSAKPGLDNAETPTEGNIPSLEAKSYFYTLCKSQTAFGYIRDSAKLQQTLRDNTVWPCTANRPRTLSHTN